MQTGSIANSRANSFFFFLFLERKVGQIIRFSARSNWDRCSQTDASTNNYENPQNMSLVLSLLIFVPLNLEFSYLHFYLLIYSFIWEPE